MTETVAEREHVRQYENGTKRQIIVCQVTARPDYVSFAWSDGVGAFEPYQLTDMPFKLFSAQAKHVRECLRNLVLENLPAKSETARQLQPQHIADASLTLARAGRKLHQIMFDPGDEHADLATDVLAWLDELSRDADASGTELVLELVLDGERL